MRSAIGLDIASLICGLLSEEMPLVQPFGHRSLRERAAMGVEKVDRIEIGWPFPLGPSFSEAGRPPGQPIENVRR